MVISPDKSRPRTCHLPSFSRRHEITLTLITPDSPDSPASPDFQLQLEPELNASRAPMMKSSISVLTVVLAAAATAVVAAAPSVRLSGSNTVYEGVHIPSFDQEAFLGVPYASQPVRFTPSRLLVPGTGRVSARTYGTSCPAYGSATTEQVTAGIITLGEDCLNLNVVRPTGENGPLPVAVWIYGGGWQQGSAADLKYNLSHIVQQSVEMGKPMIGVSINYRTAGFGFLYSQEVQVGAEGFAVGGGMRRFARS